MDEKRLKKLKPPPGGFGVQAPSAPVEQDRVWLSLERKYRVAEFESLAINLGASVTLEPGDTVPDGVKRLFSELRREFNDVLEVMRDQEGV